MGIFGINIRRKYSTRLESSQIQEIFNRLNSRGGSPYFIQTGNDKVFLSLPLSIRKWWSPELSISMENDKERNETLIRELTGPNPSTFSFAFFCIIGGAVVLLFALLLAFSQISLGMSPGSAFIASIIAFSFISIIWSIILYGRMKSRKDCHELQEYMMEVIKKHE